MGRFSQILLCGLALTAPMPAFAQDEEAEAAAKIDLIFTAGAFSDYRFRGVSLSDRDPAAQGSIDISHNPSGIYAGAWASTISNYAGAKVEVDFYAGIKRNLGPVDIDVGATYYAYPGGSGVDSYEFYGYLGRTIGPAELRAGVVYAPSQDSLGNVDNFYLTSDARVGIPSTPLTVTGSIGYEDGAFAGATGKKWDWSLGLEATKGPFTLGVGYVDTDVKRVNDPSGNSKGGFLASLSAEF